MKPKGKSNTIMNIYDGDKLSDEESEVRPMMDCFGMIDQTLVSVQEVNNDFHSRRKFSRSKYIVPLFRRKKNGIFLCSNKQEAIV